MGKFPFKEIAVLTSKRSWFLPYAQDLVEILKGMGFDSKLFNKHEEIPENYKVVFILSYFRLIPSDFLSKRKHNLVVHESDLPKGRGWSPLFWQILEGKNEIPVVLMEATEEMDAGDIYFKDYIILKGHELHDEIRNKQAKKTKELCLRFVENYDNIRPLPQRGKPTYYPKRTPRDSELDINKSIKDQFNLLRIVDNEEFPAFFYYRGHKYIIKIFKSKSDI